jgi:hypothetical protein
MVAAAAGNPVEQQHSKARRDTSIPDTDHSPYLEGHKCRANGRREGYDWLPQVVHISFPSPPDVLPIRIARVGW